MTLPALPGLGFKHEHFPAIRETCPDLGFFEVHAENYMGDGGAPHAMLTALRADYEISIHGVGLSIGGAGPLDAAHLLRLKKLCDRYEPAHFLRGFNDTGKLVPYAMAGLAARVFPAVVFWQSGRTKMDTVFTLSDSAVFLFREEYALPLIPPELAARLAALVEHIFPVLLILGLMTRLSALALLGMTPIFRPRLPDHSLAAVQSDLAQQP